MNIHLTTGILNNSQDSFSEDSKERTTAAVKIQAAARGYLVRKRIGELKLEKFVVWFNGETKKIVQQIKKVSEKVENSWKAQKISQSSEIWAIDKLCEIWTRVSLFTDIKKEGRMLNKGSKAEMEQFFYDKESRLLKVRQRFLTVCESVGFTSVKQGIKMLCGSDYKKYFSEQVLSCLEEYNLMFCPSGYNLFVCSNEAGLVTFIDENGVAVEIEEKILKSKAPFLRKPCVLKAQIGFKEESSAELFIPFYGEKGVLQMIVFSGGFKNDPINVSHDFETVLSRKRGVQNEFFRQRKIPKTFSKNYLNYYPIRDLFLKKNSEITAELNRDYLFLKKIRKEGVRPATLKTFIDSPISEQMRMFSVLLMDENPKNALFLYEMTAKNKTEYQLLLRESLHFLLQKKLNLALEELEKVKERINTLKALDVPYETKISLSGMEERIKIKAMQKLKEMRTRGHEEDKARKYLESLLGVPFGVYTLEPVTAASDANEIAAYLKKVEEKLEASVHGHKEAKEAIIEWIAQRVSNGESKGECIALEGPPGVGKTTFAKEGISKALERPFAFISMGGQSDSCYLIGHDYTYTGSTWGRIVEILKESKCMDPIIYIDEIDKVSQSDKGKEMIGVLTALTDFSQNKEFQDKYFAGISFDLSRALFVFSYNDPSQLDPVFKDRLKIIKVGAQSAKEKQAIALKHLLPEILKSCGFKKDEIVIKSDALQFLIENYTFEAGVRKLKEHLFAIVRRMNLLRLKDSNSVKLPYLIDKDVIVSFRKDPRVEFKTISSAPQVGMVNGLYATTAGIGGLTIIQVFKTLANERLQLTLTGSQGDVMRESMSVARSVAWNLIPQEVRENLYKLPPEGLHIHCPEGATPKDGPSAGGAITTAIVSCLLGIPVKNTVAMTGEIDLTGKMTKIGGLSAKLVGAKRAGVRLALIPRDNQKDLEKIIDKSPELVDEAFSVKLVDTIYDILDNALLHNPIIKPEGLVLMTETPPSELLISQKTENTKKKRAGSWTQSEMILKKAKNKRK